LKGRSFSRAEVSNNEEGALAPAGNTGKLLYNQQVARKIK
jgi:hypothetical protein